ncbi:unnamed protein product [Schistosoma curassoni]|uniref:WD_REPEATS_REGION domain-containing protein n=1 Tax=Schistosoma curassoni TaxID=6186 RepID=A0A183L230_9TREM|nr:unnamed protein product [Schistosoma curassoni]
MQLKIWCLITGRCAASLGLNCTNSNNKNEPGGHRTGILDTAIIDRGRNIASIDRLGWLRLWDVATQTYGYLLFKVIPGYGLAAPIPRFELYGRQYVVIDGFRVQATHFPDSR